VITYRATEFEPGNELPLKRCTQPWVGDAAIRSIPSPTQPHGNSEVRRIHRRNNSSACLQPKPNRQLKAQVARDLEMIPERGREKSTHDDNGQAFASIPAPVDSALGSFTLRVFATLGV
jgi:hypothetical protein